MSSSRRWLRASAHVAGLWALALAYPVLDPVSRAPEFLVAHRADAWDLVLLAAQIGVAGPLVFGALAAAVSLVGPRAVDLLTATTVGALVAVYGIQVGYRAGVTQWAPTVGIALACMVGGAGAWWRSRGVRYVLNVLAAAVVVVPVVFLASREVRPLLRSSTGRAVTRQSSGLAPVIVFVFDELPLVSLLDGDGRIDAVRYPHLAALAADGVWFRNATTVSDFTRWAVPAIVDGRYPRPGSVPSAADHPETLFTLLAPTHRLVVFEPLTALCPTAICRDAQPPRASRQRRILADVGVFVRLTLLPPAARAGLPDVTQGWSGFADESGPARVARAKDEKKDHYAIASAFIAGIGADAEQPTLYFLHSIVSHHPPHLLPSGQRIADFGVPRAMTPALTWVPAPWPVTLYHQGAIVQAGLVDTLVGRLRSRLEQAGLYDRSLIVITADHGISFVPGSPVRYSGDSSAAGTMLVPLILKLPAGHRARPPGTVDDGNVETIDVLPTIADVLGVALRAPVDGRSVFTDGPGRPSKRLFYDGARASRVFAPREVARLGGVDVARNVDVFGADRWPSPVPRPAMRALLGRPLSSIDITTVPSAPRVTVDGLDAFRKVDLAAPELPVQVKGRVAGVPRDARDSVFVAVALNGTLVAVTRASADNGRWMALLPPDGLRNGPNEVEALTVDPARPTTLLTTRTWRPLPDGLDLMADAAAGYGVRYSGFHRGERAAGTAFHWTRGAAGISLPVDDRFRRAAVDVEVLFSGVDGKRLRILVDDCEVLSDSLPAGRWTRTVPLGGCAPPGRWATIRFVSDTHRAPSESRVLGVALARVVLHESREAAR